MKVAAAQYNIGFFSHFDQFASKLEQWVDDAADCDLLVFPEYGSMELASLLGLDIYQDLNVQLRAMQSLLRPWIELHARLAKKTNTVICAASFPVKVDEQYRNRVYLFGPAGLLGHQDKIVMTRFEREHWSIQPGLSLEPIITPVGRLGVITCYDAEFPLLARAWSNKGPMCCWYLAAPTPWPAITGSRSAHRPGPWKTSATSSKHQPSAQPTGLWQLI